jgi:hypothetical protein
MSKQVALNNIRLESPIQWGHTEYSLEYHKDYLAERTGIPADSDSLIRKAYDRFAFDFLWSVHDGLIDWAEAGRATDMGHASYAADGSDQRQPAKCPFHSVEEVWAFDAVMEYGLPDFEELVHAYEAVIQKARKNTPNQLSTGGYYKTLVSGAIAAFGWDMLLMAASEPVKMEKVFDSFFRRTLFHIEAWARTDAEVLIQHDDFVWTSGAFMNPEIYRKVLIPMYAELWKPVHQAGKQVLFCSDGNFISVVVCASWEVLWTAGI